MTIKLFLPVCFFLAGTILASDNKQKLLPENKQFIYILRYTPAFKQMITWTSKELQIAKDHVSYVKKLIDEETGYVLGRATNIYDPEFFGIVIFDAANIEKANEIMQNDPLIYNHIMEGSLTPFNIVFLNAKKKN